MEEIICLGTSEPIGLTNFDRCIIRQKETPTTLQRVTSLIALSFAIEKRQDGVAKRLEKDCVLDISQHKSVMWHGECRRWYTLHKSCDLASKKRTAGILAETQINDNQDDICVAAQGSTVDSATQCIFCERPFTKRKRSSIAMTQSRGQSLKRKAEDLNDAHMLDRIHAHPGEDVDLTAIDVRYHMPCMNAYINKRCKKNSPPITMQKAKTMLSFHLLQNCIPNSLPINVWCFFQLYVTGI